MRTGKQYGIMRWKPGVNFFLPPNFLMGVSCGDAHSLIKLERHTGKQIRKTGQNDINGVKLNFVAQVVELENNNKLICNWNGHAKGKDAEQPTLIEIDKDNQLAWYLNEGNGIGKVSCVFPAQDEKTVSRFININE